MNMGRAAPRASVQPLSCHPSNPFDDPSMAKRALGYGSSDLSVYSSDLGGYGDPEPTHYLKTPDDEGPDDALVDQVVDQGANGNEQERIEADDAYDDEIGEDEAFCNEEEFEEEHSIYFKITEERHEIQAEIQDLQRAVPRLKEDYEIIDRLGTGL
jgi:hypothetical protein